MKTVAGGLILAIVFFAAGAVAFAEARLARQIAEAHQRLATLHSGAAVDTLAIDGEVTHVRLADGTEGWVKSSYLVTAPPATVRRVAHSSPGCFFGVSDETSDTAREIRAHRAHAFVYCSRLQ